ncbi:MAG: RcnB family protein [Desulfuromonadales bacterium]|nr:RcnB family protein [Desulfuromonadales bacterium]
MQNFSLQKSRILALIVVGVLAASPALADKNKWDGDDKKGNKSEQKERHLSQRDNYRENRTSTHFNDRHRTIVQDYSSSRFNSGHCPPGLAKKNNNCMPPGQAKKWTLGKPLPRDVIFHNLPREVAEQFGPPPAGQRYVRVANDILMIATGNGTVIDAIENWGNYSQ